MYLTEKLHEVEMEPPLIEPASMPRPPIWIDVPDAQWNDWRWQLANRLNTLKDFAQILNLTQDEIEGLSAEGGFRVEVTPYFASLIDPHDPNCPIRRQVIPTGGERDAFEGMQADSLDEEHQSPVRGIIHRYPDRALMLVTTECASYCRYCTRSRLVGHAESGFSRTDYAHQLDYIRRTPAIRDVLVSGGDPLMIAPRVLEDILAGLRAIPHVEVIRIGTRVPVFLPQRITDELCDMLRKYHPLWMNIHVNHPKEITTELSRALDKLAGAGIPLGNQSVLLAGINDSVVVQRELVHKLVRNRVRPYYLYQCDLVRGAGHFRTTVARGIEIIEGLRGHTSGFAVPTFVIDAPGGGGKIPVMPQYLISQSPGRVVLRNYEGFITTYEEPLDYVPANGRENRSGISGLLAGSAHMIKPEGHQASFEDDEEEPDWTRHEIAYRR